LAACGGGAPQTVIVTSPPQIIEQTGVPQIIERTSVVEVTAAPPHGYHQAFDPELRRGRYSFAGPGPGD
jgi:hypothetical protein